MLTPVSSRQDISRRRRWRAGEEGTPILADDDARAEMRWAFDQIVLDGAQRMLAAALETEVVAYCPAWPPNETSGAVAWGSVTATPSHARSPRRRAGSR
jgi:hypothetical protein